MSLVFHRILDLKTGVYFYTAPFFCPYPKPHLSQAALKSLTRRHSALSYHSHLSGKGNNLPQTDIRCIINEQSQDHLFLKMC
jgi:hypothetical protein